MKNIFSFLNKFQDLVRTKSFVEECCEVVFKNLSLPITKKEFEIVGVVLHIKSYSASLRSEIKLKKEEILRRIEEKVGSKKIIDIK